LGQREIALLLFSIFTVSACSIIYELLIGSLCSYLLGDSVRQFSITIGFTMAAMGLGAWISRAIREDLIEWFIAVEIALGLVGGLSSPALYLAFMWEASFEISMIAMIMAVGTLIGLELPLLTRIMERRYQLRLNISNVMSLDYLGALAASLLFPFLLLPTLGTLDSSLATGMANLGVGLLNLWWFRERIGGRWGARLRLYAWLAGMALALFLAFSGKFMKAWEAEAYEARVVYSRQTKYQKIVMTVDRKDVRLYIDGNLQFSSLDEARYHESLIHPALSLAPLAERALILGGGDGMAAREVLKYQGVKRIDLVDIDPEMTRLAANHYLLRRLNGGSMNNPRMRVINQDAMRFLRDSDHLYDVIIADLPDPSNSALAKLYSVEFYKIASARLAKGGIFVTQATSPYYAREAFWCIAATARAAGFASVTPYHAHVPSFGEWGFVMASMAPMDAARIKVAVPTGYLKDNIVPSLFAFPGDMDQIAVNPSGMDKQDVVRYYMAGWRYWR
jgi:spermidine synthase